MNEIKYGFKGSSVTLQRLKEDVGAGWSDLIETLVLNLFALGWNGVVLQVKEKFGGLRFYVGSASDAVHARIADAEKESTKICEECGLPGVIRDGGWLKTLCEEHAKGRVPFSNND